MSDLDDSADTSGAGDPERPDVGIDEPTAVDGCGGADPDVDTAVDRTVDRTVDAAVDAVSSDDEAEGPDPGSGWGGWGTDASI